MFLNTTRSVRRAGIIAFLVVLAACTAETELPDSSTTSQEETSVLEAVSPEARITVGGGEPRSAGYWITWSTCGEDNRSETAASNGGREAGWLLLDDLLADPGIQLGDHDILDCEEAVAVLAAVDSVAETGLARELLTALLNHGAGSESCLAAEESISVASALLGALKYEGPEEPAHRLDATAGDSLTRLTDLLHFYNSGALCQ